MCTWHPTFAGAKRDFLIKVSTWAGLPGDGVRNLEDVTHQRAKLLKVVEVPAPTRRQEIRRHAFVTV